LRRFEKAKQLMKRERVYFTPAKQTRAAMEILRSLQKRSIEVKASSIDTIHMHALARVTARNPRYHMGVHGRVCALWKMDGLAPVGGLWGVRCACVPIADGRHFKNVRDYILDHELQRAIIWPAQVQPSCMENPMDDFDPNSLLLD
jgi:hypothetical protein